jgi:hypothetical protein
MVCNADTRVIFVQAKISLRLVNSTAAHVVLHRNVCVCVLECLVGEVCSSPGVPLTWLLPPLL